MQILQKIKDILRVSLLGKLNSNLKQYQKSEDTSLIQIIFFAASLNGRVHEFHIRFGQ